MDENPPMIALMPIEVAEICVAIEAHDILGTIALCHVSPKAW